MNPARRYLAVIPFVSILLLVCGCASTLSMVTVPATAVNLGTMAYQSIENAQVLIRVHEGLSEESAREIRRIAVFMGKENRVEPHGRIGDLEAVVGDNLGMQLARKGFCVYDADDIRKIEGKPHPDGDYYRGKMLRTCEVLGAQAMISGHVVAGRTGFGIFGIGRQKTVVHSVSLRMTEIRTVRTLMTIDIQYKIGQKPHIAAEGLAMILEAKLNDPDCDIQTLFRRKDENSSCVPAGGPDRLEKDPRSLQGGLP